MSKNTNLSFLTDYITADITNGRIGINNASPAYSFDVTGVARTSTSTYLATASGNVGIGTTSPFSQGTGATSLEINGTNYGQLFVTANSAAARGTIMARSSDVYIAAITNSPLLFGTNDTLRLTIASTGAATFTNTVETTGAYFSNGNAYFGKASSIFTGGSANDGGLMVSGSNNLIFGNALTERMRITSAGNVGIGTSSPSQKLDVNGTIRAAGAFVQATGNIFVGDWTGFYDINTSTSRVYLLQLVPTDTIPLLNYRLFGVIQANTTSGTYYFTTIASQTMEVRFVGNVIQVRITNGNGYYFNWSITQLC